MSNVKHGIVFEVNHITFVSAGTTMMRRIVTCLLLALLATDVSAFSKIPTSPGQKLRGTKVVCDAFPRTIVAGVTLLCWSSLKVVSQGDVAIVERLGKFHKRLDPGLHVVFPVIDRLRTTISQREQVFDIPPQKCITSDNAPLSADAVVYWRVVDPSKAFYSVMDLKLAIQNLVLTQLRAEIGKLTLDMTFSAREQINSVLLRDLDVATDPWGVKITRVEVRDIIPNQEIMQAMELQMAAERTKRAVVIKSEGERARAINEAEGKAQSRLIDAKASAESTTLRASAEASKLELEAEGAAKALELISNALGNSNDAARFQLMREYISAQRALATSSNSKVIVSPDSVNDIFVKAMAFTESSLKSE
jgi:regulator of protease activity HflC (stomatin/prohibitin superfamily)